MIHEFCSVIFRHDAVNGRVDAEYEVGILSKQNYGDARH
jgi:hypothetical protein